jgi:hypothetical protein
MPVRVRPGAPFSQPLATVAQVRTVDKVHPMFTDLVKRDAATRPDIVA